MASELETVEKPFVEQLLTMGMHYIARDLYAHDHTRITDGQRRTTKP